MREAIGYISEDDSFHQYKEDAARADLAYALDKLGFNEDAVYYILDNLSAIKHLITVYEKECFDASKKN